MSECKVHSGSTFLVCNYTVQYKFSEFYEWLNKEGFKAKHVTTLGSLSGRNDWSIYWLYIDTVSKYYSLGLPGIKLCKVVGDHAITVEEFKQIYNIYKKYDGKEVFVFNSERFCKFA